MSTRETSDHEAEQDREGWSGDADLDYPAPDVGSIGLKLAPSDSTPSTRQLSTIIGRSLAQSSRMTGFDP
ncbi:MAG: hypothetical protein AAGJ19_05795 [Myxococcota bacterium]